MATSPFLPDETKPQATDLISQYPSVSQTFRDVIESWLLLISTTSGVLRADAMPALFDAIEVENSMTLNAAGAADDVFIQFRDEADVLQTLIKWDDSEDNFQIIQYADDGTTPRGTLKIGGDSDTFTYNASEVIRANSALATAIVGTGALDAGSITSGFGSINIGADALTAGAASFTTLAASAAAALSSSLTVGTTLGVTGVLTATGGIELVHASDTTLSRFAAGVLGVEGVAVYSQIPVTDKSTAYTAVLADANTGIRHPSTDANDRTFTIPANASVAYPIGTVLTFLNEANTVTIAINSDTLTLAVTGGTGSRTLTAHGIATAWKVTSTKWYISGVGLA